MDANVCAQCGGGLPPGAMVCPFCGTRVEAPTPPPTTVYQGPAPMNGLAVASLVLSLLWIIGIASAVAVVCGYLANKQIKQTGERGQGLATAGLVIGSFGVITGILIVSLGTIGNHQETKHDSARARADILAIASAEITQFNARHNYSNSTTQLGVGNVLGFRESINVAASRTGFCVVGSYGVDQPWFLYDSSQGGAGLATMSYSSGFLAEQACRVPNISPFDPVS